MIILRSGLRNFFGFSMECGSAHCIAGHAVLMTGGVFNRYGLVGGTGYGSPSVHISRYAQTKLGLTDEEVWGFNEHSKWIPGLFNGTATRADIQVVAERIAARAGERL
jgi:hypothetical protein